MEPPHNVAVPEFLSRLHPSFTPWPELFTVTLESHLGLQSRGAYDGCHVRQTPCMENIDPCDTVVAMPCRTVCVRRCSEGASPSTPWEMKRSQATRLTHPRVFPERELLTQHSGLGSRSSWEQHQKNAREGPGLHPKWRWGPL